MSFSDYFKQQIILEKDLRPVLIKNGLPPELAEICHNISDKYAGFVANVLFLKNIDYLEGTPEDKEEYIQNIKNTPYNINMAKQVINQLFSVENKPKLPKNPNQMSLREASDLLNQWPTIKDWYTSPMVQNKPNIRNLTWEDAYRMADEWHKELAANAEDETSLTIKGGQEIVIKFPDGSYWLKLNKTYCSDEANAMGHCGQASTGELFSLRDVKGVPKVTADINVDDEKAGQIFCKGNSKPPQKYHRKILTLLGDLNIHTIKPVSYGEGSLSIKDLSEEDKEWFQETYNYEISSHGISESQRKKGKEILDEANKQMKFCYVDDYTDNMGDDANYETLGLGIQLDLNDFDVIEYEKDINDFSFPKVIGHTPIEHEEPDRQDNILRWFGQTNYNTETETYDNDYSPTSYTRWIDYTCDEMRRFDKKIQENYAELVVALIEQEFITPDKATDRIEWIHKNQNEKMELIGSSAGFSIIRPKSYYQIEQLEKSHEEYLDQSPIEKALNTCNPNEDEIKLIDQYLNHLNKGRVVDAFFAKHKPETQLYFDFIRQEKFHKKNTLFTLQKQTKYNETTGINLVSASLLDSSDPQASLIFNIVQRTIKDESLYRTFKTFILTILGVYGAMKQKNTIKQYAKNADYLNDLVFNSETGDILENFWHYFNKHNNILLESPISDITLTGDWSNPKPQGYDKKSIKLLTNPNYLEKVKSKWAKTPEQFDLYFLKDKKLRQYAEIGEVSLEFIKDKLKLNLIPKEDHITVIYCNNIGDEKVPLTPYIIAHRFGHALRRIYPDRQNEMYTYFENEYKRDIKHDIVPLLYGENKPNFYSYAPYAKPQKYNKTDDTLFSTLNQIATFKSARDNNVRNISEFTNEFIAQYIVTGKITLNKDYNKLPRVISSYAWGKPQYTPLKHLPEDQKENFTDYISNIEDIMNYNMEQMLGSALNKIYVM